MPKLLRTILGHVISIGAFLVLFAISVFITQGYRYNFEENTFIQTGVIDLCVIPNNAAVFLDGAPHDDNSCLKIYGLPVGPHKLEVKKPGYFTWEKNLYLDKEKVTIYPQTFLIPLPDFWNSSLLEKGVANMWVSPNKTRFASYDPKMNVINIFSATQSAPTILEVPAPVTNLTWMDDDHLVADTQKGRFENSIGGTEWEQVTEIVLRPFQEDSELIVEGNEIWKKDSSGNTFITRYAQPVVSASLFYDTSSLLIATTDEIRLCDFEGQNCQAITKKDLGTPIANPPHSNKIIFIKDGDLRQITLNGPTEETPEINI